MTPTAKQRTLASPSFIPDSSCLSALPNSVSPVAASHGGSAPLPKSPLVLATLPSPKTIKSPLVATTAYSANAMPIPSPLRQPPTPHQQQEEVHQQQQQQQQQVKEEYENVEGEEEEEEEHQEEEEEEEEGEEVELPSPSFLDNSPFHVPSEAPLSDLALLAAADPADILSKMSAPDSSLNWPTEIAGDLDQSDDLISTANATAAAAAAVCEISPPIWYGSKNFDAPSGKLTAYSLTDNSNTSNCTFEGNVSGDFDCRAQTFRSDSVSISASNELENNNLEQRSSLDFSEIVSPSNTAVSENTTTSSQSSCFRNSMEKLEPESIPNNHGANEMDRLFSNIKNFQEANTAKDNIIEKAMAALYNANFNERNTSAVPQPNFKIPNNADTLFRNNAGQFQATLSELAGRLQSQPATASSAKIPPNYPLLHDPAIVAFSCSPPSQDGFGLPEHFQLAQPHSAQPSYSTSTNPGHIMQALTLSRPPAPTTQFSQQQQQQQSNAVHSATFAPNNYSINAQHISQSEEHQSRSVGMGTAASNAKIPRAFVEMYFSESPMRQMNMKAAQQRIARASSPSNSLDGDQKQPAADQQQQQQQQQARPQQNHLNPKKPSKQKKAVKNSSNTLWATENVNDYHGNEFDFNSNLDRFDKAKVFENYARKDTKDPAERLVAINRVPSYELTKAPVISAPGSPILPLLPPPPPPPPLPYPSSASSPRSLSRSQSPPSATQFPQHLAHAPAKTKANETDAPQDDFERTPAFEVEYLKYRRAARQYVFTASDSRHIYSTVTKSELNRAYRFLNTRVYMSLSTVTDLVGAAIADCVFKTKTGETRASAVVFCGDNVFGEYAMAGAKQLAARGTSVFAVILPSGHSTQTPSVQPQSLVLQAAMLNEFAVPGLTIIPLHQQGLYDGSTQMNTIRHLIATCNVIVDGILGLHGFAGTLTQDRENMCALISAVRMAGRPKASEPMIVSLGLPSGACARTGLAEIPPHVVHPSVVLCVGAPTRALRCWMAQAKAQKAKEPAVMLAACGFTDLAWAAARGTGSAACYYPSAFDSIGSLVHLSFQLRVPSSDQSLPGTNAAAAAKAKCVVVKPHEKTSGPTVNNQVVSVPLSA